MTESPTNNSGDDRDFLVRRGEYSENLAKNHIKYNEFDKAAKLFKEAFNYYKKAGDKDACLRVKGCFDSAMESLKQTSSASS